MLEQDLDGTSPAWGSGDRWRQVRAGYVEKFGPAASTIGPPDPMAAESTSSES